MCGIAGVVRAEAPRRAENLADAAERMATRLSHRGPDGSGIWVDAEAGVALAHRRLAIIDLSSTGAQPMQSTSGRTVITYNGEIYNFGMLRQELEATGARFRGTSDTEVLLVAIERWGLRSALQRCHGMFALALWDRQQRRLVLARDRMGEKPLYYARAGGCFVFASELKALRAHPDLDTEIDRDAVTLLLRHKCIPAPHSVYRSVRKLKPGCILTLEPRKRGSAPSITVYWSVEDAVRLGQTSPLDGEDLEVVDEVHQVLRASVRERLVADVPVGAFLSGGIDSSTVVSLMQAESTGPVRTFTIGSEDDRLDEAARARSVAEHLGTEHTEICVSSADAQAGIPLLPRIYDEPFADQSQIPTYLVSRLARSSVTVGLSGDGGDELFGGYTRYARTVARWRRMAWMPAAARRVLAAGLARGATRWQENASTAPGRLASLSISGRPVDRALFRGSTALAAARPELLYREVVSDWAEPARVVRRSREPETLLCRPDLLPPIESLWERMMFLDACTYLPDDILVKLDRASMAVGLEARVPMLDHDVVELSWRLPTRYKIRDGINKWVLRAILRKYLPDRLVEGPKMGFGIPLAAWLRGPLREWAESLLDPHRLRQEDFFEPEPVARLWNGHITGEAGATDQLWNVLMFQAWLDEERRVPQPQ